MPGSTPPFACITGRHDQRHESQNLGFPPAAVRTMFSFSHRLASRDRFGNKGLFRHGLVEPQPSDRPMVLRPRAALVSPGPGE